jgi:hypothetical protein
MPMHFAVDHLLNNASLVWETGGVMICLSLFLHLFAMQTK